MGISLFLGGIVAAVLGGLILAEVTAWSPRVSRFLTSFSANRLPLAIRARYREEWLSYLGDMPTGISKLIAGVGFLFTAEKSRWSVGVRALLAVVDYLRLWSRLRPYVREARAFGGSTFGVRLSKQSCGNRHVVLAALFPLSATSFIKDFNDTYRHEARNDGLDLSEERASIIARAQLALASSELPQRNAVQFGSERMTNFIVPARRDPRPIRTMLALFWQFRRRRIRRRIRRSAARR